jgi:hypothetical protein
VQPRGEERQRRPITGLAVSRFAHVLFICAKHLFVAAIVTEQRLIALRRTLARPRVGPCPIPRYAGQGVPLAH